MSDSGSVGIRGGEGGRASGARPILISPYFSAFKLTMGKKEDTFVERCLRTLLEIVRVVVEAPAHRQAGALQQLPTP